VTWRPYQCCVSGRRLRIRPAKPLLLHFVRPGRGETCSRRGTSSRSRARSSSTRPPVQANTVEGTDPSQGIRPPCPTPGSPLALVRTLSEHAHQGPSSGLDLGLEGAEISPQAGPEGSCPGVPVNAGLQSPGVESARFRRAECESFFLSAEDMRISDALESLVSSEGSEEGEKTQRLRPAFLMMLLAVASARSLTR